MGEKLKIKNLGKLSTAVVLSSTIFLCGCNSLKTDEHVEGHNGYAQHVCYLESKERYDSGLTGVFYDDGNYYVSVVYSKDAEVITTINVINGDGEIVSQTDMEGNQSPYCMYEGFMVYYTNNNEIVLYNPENGSLVNTIEFNEGHLIEGIASGDDGIVVLESDKITLVDDAGNSKGQIKLDGQTTYASDYPYFEADGNDYVVTYDDDTGGYTYFKVDFTTGFYEEVAKSSMFTEMYPEMCCFGGYYIDDVGEYKIDLAAGELSMLADWNDVDIKPQEMSLLMEPEWHSMDDAHFGKSYIYAGGDIEMLFFEYDSSIDNSNKEKITIGGYGLDDDLAIQWCRYLFNTENDEYRVILEDYGEDFGYLTSAEAESKTAELIQYFNQGNAPDIFYGETFDYNYFGLNGMVVDMSGYMENDEAVKNQISDNIMNAFTNEDGSCYRVFSSYMMDGFFGLADNFESNDISWDELREMFPENTLFGDLYATELFGFSYLNDLERIYLSGNLNEETVGKILTYAVTEGVNPITGEQKYNDMNSLMDNEYILKLGISNEITDFVSGEEAAGGRIRFIGYPSLEGSIHLMYPSGLVAISDSSEHPDVCWQVISYMFSERVQTLLTVNQSIPVNRQVLDKYIGYLETPDSVPESDKVMRSGIKRIQEITGREKIDPDIMEDWKEAALSGDTVKFYDWGATNIAEDEIRAYYDENKPFDEVVESLTSRLELYMKENYG